jgi:hypothetical protein
MYGKKIWHSHLLVVPIRARKPALMIVSADGSVKLVVDTACKIA